MFPSAELSFEGLEIRLAGLSKVLGEAVTARRSASAPFAESPEEFRRGLSDLLDAPVRETGHEKRNDFKVFDRGRAIQEAQRIAPEVFGSVPTCAQGDEAFKILVLNKGLPQFAAR